MMVPSGWEISSADDVTFKITKGTTPPKTEIVNDSQIPFLRVNNLSFNGLLNYKTEILAMFPLTVVGVETNCFHYNFQLYP